MEYVGRILNFFDGEDCHSTVAGPPSNERELDEPLESADGLSDSYHSMCIGEDRDDDQNEKRVFLDVANEGEPNENITYEDITDQDNTDEVITDQDKTNEAITDQDHNTDRDISDQNDTDETIIESGIVNAIDDETMKNSVSLNNESLVLGDSLDRRERDGPVREDLCEDESILTSAIDECPIDHHQPATSALEDLIDFSEVVDHAENAMCEEDAISSSGSCTATAGSSTKTIDSEDTPEEYSRIYLSMDQLRLMEQQRQDAMREHLNMAWQSSLNHILNRNAVEMTKVMDLLSRSRWETARLRTEVAMLKTKLHDRASSQHQLLKLLKAREREVDDMNNDMRELGAECAELMDEVSKLKKMKDQENHMIECLMKEKADLQMHIQELKEEMETKQVEHESVVNQLKHEKSELQDALSKSQTLLE